MLQPEERSQAVRELCNRRGTARKVAQSIGVSVPVLYKWKKDLISDEAYQSMRKRKAALRIKIRMLYSVKSSISGSRFISCSSNVTY
jgi:transposase-like protein